MQETQKVDSLKIIWSIGFYKMSHSSPQHNVHSSREQDFICLPFFKNTIHVFIIK